MVCYRCARRLPVKSHVIADTFPKTTKDSASGNQTWTRYALFFFYQASEGHSRNVCPFNRLNHSHFVRVKLNVKPHEFSSEESQTIWSKNDGLLRLERTEGGLTFTINRFCFPRLKDIRVPSSAIQCLSWRTSISPLW